MADILAAVSVLLVFLTLLLTGLQKETDELLNAAKPPATAIERLKRANKDILKMLWVKSVPICLVFLIIFYVLLPKTIEIISTCEFSIWHFDILDTLFVLIEFGILGLGIFGFVKAWQLGQKYLSDQ